MSIDDGLGEDPDDNEETDSSDDAAVDSEPDDEVAVKPASESVGGFQFPAGFVQSLLPEMDDTVARMIAPIQERLKDLMPDLSAYTSKIIEPITSRLQAQITASMTDYESVLKNIVEPHNEQVRAQMASIVSALPTFTVPTIGIPSLSAFEMGAETSAIFQAIANQQSSMLEGLRGSLEPLFDPALFHGLNRALLPPNLKDYANEIQAAQVHEFLEQEGIPLYLVPRGRTALRLLRAPDRSARRRVLGECYESLVDDCAVVLEKADRALIGDELGFALDGLGAMRAGHVRSAQAMFTVTLDTLIYRFYPDREVRKAITNRKKGAAVPDTIDEMGVREAMVWLPIWNAHEQFWQHKGDSVPHYYSRHASVHGVSSRQFSKRNCVQVLMLVTSLIGYAERVVSSNANTGT